MPNDILMPKLSDNMEDGLVIRWLKSPGDHIDKGEPLVEVETEKADVEVEAPASGTLGEVLVGEGERAAVGAVLAKLSDGAGAEQAAPPEPSQEPGAAERGAQTARPKPSQEPGAAERGAQTAPRAARAASGDSKRPTPRSAEVPPSADRVLPPRATPLARRAAAQSGQDLGDIEATGPGGRVSARDVDRANAKGGARATTAAGAGERAEAEGSGTASSSQDARNTPAPASGAALQEHSRMRQAIARRMFEAKRDVPHFYVAAEIDMSEASRIRDAIKESGVLEGFTYTHLLLRALAVTLPRHPRLNASYQEDGVALHHDVNIGIAVGLDDGLLVPVLRGVQDMTLREIVEGANALVERARRGKFHGDDLTGGTISLSNVGMLDVDQLTAILNPPQAAILAVAAVKERPVVRAGALAVGRTMHATLSCDHRVVNGVEAGRFLADLKQVLERPATLLLDS